MVTETAKRTDIQVQRAVLDELAFEGRLQPNEIGVAVKNGVVTLTGWVDSYATKWAAEEAAFRVPGVQAVANDIEVRLPIASERTDADIAAAAVRALEWDTLVPADRIRVSVSKGWVTLEGQVEWQYQREDAERAVHRLTGVRGVSNMITVVPTIRPTPSDLKRKIEDALLRRTETDAKRITVEVDGNKVILKGTVRSWAEKQEAERAAWSAPGVASIDNQIKVADVI
jgi:osmotically-inducible protein OsmY